MLIQDILVAVMQCDQFDHANFGESVPSVTLSIPWDSVAVSAYLLRYASVYADYTGSKVIVT